MIALLDLARELGVDARTIGDVASSAGLSVVRIVYGSQGKTHGALAPDDADAVRMLVRSQARSGVSIPKDKGQGFLYVVQPMPSQAPTHVKIGFTISMPRRLREYQTSCPSARVLLSWPCLRRWEQTALDALTVGARRLGPEVWEVPSLIQVQYRGDEFFNLLPALPDATAW